MLRSLFAPASFALIVCACSTAPDTPPDAVARATEPAPVAPLASPSAWAVARQVLDQVQTEGESGASIQIQKLDARGQPGGGESSAFVQVALQLRAGGTDAVEATVRYHRFVERLRALPGCTSVEVGMTEELRDGSGIEAHGLRIRVEATAGGGGQPSSDDPAVLIRRAAAEGVGPVRISREQSSGHVEAIYRVDAMNNVAFEVARPFLDALENAGWSAAVTRVKLDRKGDHWAVWAEIKSLPQPAE